MDIMSILLGVVGVVLFLGLFGLLFWTLAGAQKADNRNSNSDQSSYESPPPGH
jgi:flagellar basal body-associated protein FliL